MSTGAGRHNCAQLNHPGIYVRVKGFTKWIKEHVTDGFCGQKSKPKEIRGIGWRSRRKRPIKAKKKVTVRRISNARRPVRRRSKRRQRKPTRRRRKRRKRMRIG